LNEEKRKGEKRKTGKEETNKIGKKEKMTRGKMIMRQERKLTKEETMTKHNENKENTFVVFCFT
jgi:hypothetical protein